MGLTNRSAMPLGPHKGKPMSRVPVAYLEEFAFSAQPRGVDTDVDAVLDYIQANPHRIAHILED